MFGRRIVLPARRRARIALGTSLIAGGLVGFLPVVGFWMIPAGVVVLAYDLPAAERLRRAVVGLVRRDRRQRRDGDGGG